MAEIDSLGTSYYFSGLQNAANEALQKNKKAEEVNKSRKLRFSELLKSEKTDEEANTLLQGLPAEIAEMSVEDAAIYLKEAVDNAGNALSSSVNKENIERFKISVKQFVSFVVSNNFDVQAPRKKDPYTKKDKIVASRSNLFSNYSLPPHRIDPRYQIQVINKKLDEFTRETLSMQRDNLKLLDKANEIKGLIIDLMSS